VADRADEPRVRILQRLAGVDSLRLPGRDDGDTRPYIAVMDGDLQHDEGILPAMLQKIRNESSTWSSPLATPRAEAWGNSQAPGVVEQSGRRLSQSVSILSSAIDEWFFHAGPQVFGRSGALCLRCRLQILLILLPRCAARPFWRVPYTFRKRIHGTSKLTRAESGCRPPCPEAIIFSMVVHGTGAFPVRPRARNSLRLGLRYDAQGDGLSVR